MIPFTPKITVVPVDIEPKREFIPTHASLNTDGSVSLGGYFKPIITGLDDHWLAGSPASLSRNCRCVVILDPPGAPDQLPVWRRGVPIFLVAWRADIAAMRDPERPQIELPVETVMILTLYATLWLVFGAVPFIRWLAGIGL